MIGPEKEKKKQLKAEARARALAEEAAKKAAEQAEKKPREDALRRMMANIELKEEVTVGAGNFWPFLK